MRGCCACEQCKTQIKKKKVLGKRTNTVDSTQTKYLKSSKSSKQSGRWLLKWEEVEGE